jgi:hypothetical protein
MEILVSHQSPEVEKSRVSPVRCQEQVGRTRAGLQTWRQPKGISVGQACTPCRNLGAERDRCLCSSSRRISPVEAILYEHHGIAKSSSPNCWCGRHLEVIGDDRKENRQIKIVAEPPREVEIGLVREGRAGSHRNAGRYSRQQAACGEDGVVGEESAARKQWRGSFRGWSLASGRCSAKQQDERQPQAAPVSNSLSKNHEVFPPAKTKTTIPGTRMVKPENDWRSD